jgi:hypothetical protein
MLEVEEIKNEFEKLFAGCKDKSDVEYADLIVKCILNIEKNKREEELKC